MPDGFRVVDATPYALLAVRGKGTPPELKLPLPARACASGGWLVAELKQALDRIKADTVRDKERWRKMKVGLSLAPGEAHVVALDDPELDLRVDPKILLDGHGNFPCTLLWNTTTGPLVVVSEIGRQTEVRYWVACCV